jgi:hypothetical protein
MEKLAGYRPTIPSDLIRKYNIVEGHSNLSRLVPHEQTTLEWFLKCTCSQITCHCLARLRPYILCLIGVPNHTQTPISPLYIKKNYNNLMFFYKFS